MNQPSDRARYDTAMDYVKQAYPAFQRVFNSENKMANLVVAYVLLDCAVRCLGEQNIQEILDSDPSCKNMVAQAQEELPLKIKKLNSIEDGAPDNVIYVDFRSKEINATQT